MLYKLERKMLGLRMSFSEFQTLLVVTALRETPRLH